MMNASAVDVDSSQISCKHEHEVEDEILVVNFDSNDVAEIVARKCWMCYNCGQVTNTNWEIGNVKQHQIR